MLKRKIALYIDSLVGGGAEKVVMSLARGLLTLGHDVHLFVLCKRVDYQLSSEYPIHFLKLHRTKGWFNRGKLARDLENLVAHVEQKEGKFNLHLANLGESYRIVSACDFTPCYFVIHNSLKDTLARLRRGLNPLTYAYFRYQLWCLNNKHLITVSDGIKFELETYNIVKAASIQRIYNPFEIDHIRELSKQPTQDLPDKYLIHIGRASKQKRHDILFAALKDIPKHYKLVCLCMRKSKLKALAKRLGLQDRIICVDFTQNPYPWMKNAELMLLSSDFEGLPTVVIESLICGVPVVSTNCPHGPSEILQGDLAHWLVPRRDPKALASKACEALEANIKLDNIKILEHVDHIKIAKQYAKLAN